MTLLIRPTIGLCIPAFNATAFLERLLVSAARQTIPFDDIWLYDDASTDGTAELAKRLGAKVVRGDVNRGCSHGKNALAAQCTCTWLHFHDADDALELNFTESASRWTEKAGAPDIIFFSYRTLEDGSERLLGTREFDGFALRKDPLGYCLGTQINPFCGLYRREAFLKSGGWDEDPRVLQSEDQAGHLRFALAGLKFDADPTFAIINYIRQGSMTTLNPAGAQRSTYEVLRKGTLLAPSKYHEIIAHRLWLNAGVSAAFNDWYNADRAADLAIKIAPSMQVPGGLLMRWGARYSPRFILRARELLIRTFRPQDRSPLIYGQRTPSHKDE